MTPVSTSIESKSELRIEDMCRFKPTITEVLAEIFAQYEFSFGNSKMLSQEVFATDSFLPVISHLACLRISDIFNIPFAIETVESESAIMGVEINPDIHSSSSVILYLLQLIEVSKSIFGVVPTPIDLDDLYQWSMNEEMQAKGTPYLGLKQGD